MSIELKITIKDEEGRKLMRPFLLYEQITMSEHDQVIDKHLKELLEEFKGIPEDIDIVAKMKLK